MNIAPNIRIIDTALYLADEHILCIADTHIGYEESLAKQGILMPKVQFELTLGKLAKIFEEAGPVSTFIIDGDVKDDFGELTDSEWSELRKLFDFLKKKAEQIILIKGNHDNYLPTIAKRFDVELKEHYEQGPYLFQHGDKERKTDKKTIIIGHEHPSLALQDGQRRENYKCFLAGSIQKKQLIVLPSFNPLTEGTDVLLDKRLSPLLLDINDFEVFVAGDKPLAFGKVKALKKKFT